MSATFKAAVLAKAIELWADPARRIKGEYDNDQGYCAIGVLRAATQDCGCYYAMGDAAKLLSMPENAIVDFNDRPGPEGQDFLYRHMKDALAKELA